MTPEALCIFLILFFINNSSAQFIGDKCVESSECDSYIGLECVNEICICRNETIYDEDDASCKILTGGDCADTNLNCVPHAYCHYNGLTSICRCERRYSEGPDRLCLPSYESPCDITSDCNPHDQLICTYGRCQCPNPLNHEFNEDLRLCVIKVGAHCNPSDSLIRCNVNMTCLPDNLSVSGHSCQCNEGLLPDFHHDRCRKSHQQPCTEPEYDTENCQEEVGLGCRLGRCECINFPGQIWDITQQVCGGVEGTKCSVYDDKDSDPLFCQTGLECQRRHGHIYGICSRA